MKPARLQARLDAIAAMPPTALQAGWATVVSGPAPRLPIELLRRELAWRVQEKAQGGLPAMVVRELAKIAAGEAPVSKPAPELRPGAQLIREWQGRTVSVLVEEGGFLWEGKRYASLSSIAKAVTGAHWSGPRFFGIKARG